MTDTKRRLLESLIEGNKNHIKALELQNRDFERALESETEEIWRHGWRWVDIGEPL